MIKIEESKIIAFYETKYNIKINQKNRKDLLKSITDYLGLKIDLELKINGIEGLFKLMKLIHFEAYRIEIGNGIYAVEENYLIENFPIENINPLWYKNKKEIELSEEDLMCYKVVSYLSNPNLENRYYNMDSFFFNRLEKYINFVQNHNELKYMTVIVKKIENLIKLFDKNSAKSLELKIYLKEKIEKEKEGYESFLNIVLKPLNERFFKNDEEKRKNNYMSGRIDYFISLENKI